jgi:hypothetical protein
MIYDLANLPAKQRRDLIKEIVAFGDKQFQGRKRSPHAEVSKEEIVAVFLSFIQRRLICGEIEI